MLGGKAPSHPADFLERLHMVSVCVPVPLGIPNQWEQASPAREGSPNSTFAQRQVLILKSSSRHLSIVRKCHIHGLCISCIAKLHLQMRTSVELRSIICRGKWYQFSSRERIAPRKIQVSFKCPPHSKARESLGKRGVVLKFASSSLLLFPSAVRGVRVAYSWGHRGLILCSTLKRTEGDFQRFWLTMTCS